VDFVTISYVYFHLKLFVFKCLLCFRGDVAKIMFSLVNSIFIIVLGFVTQIFFGRK
jgi:hypothetical protein